ncbi:hypothetical protein J2S42_001225 [Catenuloplanes indicus]|uniref:Uncharacterized protein n=1 Tax=Catenuloplanes indicus TaxID=137267 RepID=A0AAE3VVK8_9ACTN|nr:hypothetical protein [Catenuloplanes indicus]
MKPIRGSPSYRAPNAAMKAVSASSRYGLS